MPSAENITSDAVKVERAPQNGSKRVENSKNENIADLNEKSVPAIQQALSIISNKVRNLEKRKVGAEPHPVVRNFEIFPQKHA